MKRILNLTLVAGLMLTGITTIDAAPAQIKPAPAKVVKKQPSRKWSLKTKALAALGVVATAAVAYLAYRYRISKQESSIIDETIRFERPVEPAYQVPAGRPRALFNYSRYQSENFQQAMRNPQSAHNIEQLFNDERFVALINNPRADLVEERLRAAFNTPAIINMSAYDNFVDFMLDAINLIMPG